MYMEAPYVTLSVENIATLFTLHMALVQTSKVFFIERAW